MRIISGLAKGVRLVSPPARQLAQKEIRPTSDRAREALFSILCPKLPGAAVLDLFAGTGALGLEALSRGADTVVFVDNNPVALKILQKNILRCLDKIDGNKIVRTIQLTLPAPLPYQDLPQRIQRGFDLIFADPPYQTGLSEEIIQSTIGCDLIDEDAVLVIEENQSISLAEKTKKLIRIDKRQYGEISFNFYQKKSHHEHQKNSTL